MKFLLSTLNAKYIHTNLAIRLLYELNYKNSNLFWKEFTIKENQDDVAEFCKDFEVVAFSCYIWNISQTLEVAEKIKAKNPNTKILLGGPEVSYEYEQVIINENIDFIIVGEGEIPFTDFLENYPNTKNVPSLVFKEEGKIFSNPLPKTFDVKNFKNSMPYQFDSIEELKNKVLYLETSRGCPYKCEFCLASLDNKVRYLPMNTIKATLLFLMQHGRVIKFLDRTFNIKRDFTLEIFEFILQHHHPQNVFQFEITADILHPDIIKFIHERVPKNLFRFEIGIQSVNQEANLSVSRKQNFYKTKKIIEDLQYKIEMHLDLIVGLPLDYLADIKFSFEETFKLYASELQLGFLKFLKGTTMRHKPEHEFEFDAQPPYQIIKSKYLSETELISITKLEHSLEVYWNNKRALNTLKYIASRYSIFDFLLGVGIYFETKRSLHNYSLNDVFEILMDYSKANHPQDLILQQLIAIDYYLHFKVKPQILFLNEVDKAIRNSIVESRNLNHHKFRFVILKIDFDFEKFIEENFIENKKTNLIIQYDGVTKSKIVSAKKSVEQMI